MKRSLAVFLSLLLPAHLWATGAWAQSHVKESNALARQASALQESGDIQGRWYGIIEAGGNRLRLILKLTKASDGSFSATLDSPDQGATDLPVDAVSFKEGMLRFEIKRLSASYKGTLSPNGLQILGTWKQGGNSLSLIFRRPDRRPS